MGLTTSTPPRANWCRAARPRLLPGALDTDYDGRSLFPHQVFFPMAGKDEGWMKLKKDIRAELDEDLLKPLPALVSLPFEAGAQPHGGSENRGRPGIESLKVMKLPGHHRSVRA
jgi:adenine-specific DNA-methyltransferase